MSLEKRFCDTCMSRTLHEMIQDDEVVYTYKRKRLYKCRVCGSRRYLRGLRPSAESVY